MNFKLEARIGIEIHLELSTETKMFSPAKNKFDAPPNTNVHPIDLGYLGTLPRPNKQAVIFAIKLAKALNMSVADQLIFDRKHYYYPDLPKSYQITQQFHPIGRDGYVFIKDSEDNTKKVLIERIHLEEDTAKQIHVDGTTLLDYNRCGIPLIEIVSGPIFRDAVEASNYVKLIRQIALALRISDAKMEQGSLRVDLNVSVAKEGAKVLGRRVEIKNLNSIANIRKALESEIEQQKARILAGKTVKQVTKRYDESLAQTVFMRKKESSIDYYYFPEPNIPIINLPKDFLDKITFDELP